DTKGCTSTTKVINVNIRPPLSTAVGIPSIVCPGFPGTVSVTASGGLGGFYSYVWRDANGVMVGNTSTVTVTPTQSPQTYYVEVSDGCQTPHKFDSTQILWYGVPVPSFT